MGELAFSFNEFVWSIFNLAIFSVVIIVPIWLIKKVKSIDITLKEIKRKLDK